MYDKIMVPVDLSHRDALQKGIKTAADIARANDATITFVGITTAEPSAAGHTPDEFKQKLADFAKEQAEQHGVQIDSESRVSHDPAIDKDDILEEVVETEGFDLVVMSSHVPGLMEHVFSSNAGYLAAHSKVSVFVVRG